MGKKIILIPEELYDQISELAADYNEGPDDMAKELLNAQITRALQEKATMFYPGRKFEIDPKTMVQAVMLESDLTRLHSWLKGEPFMFNFIVCGKNELLIINQSKQKNPPEIEVKT